MCWTRFRCFDAESGTWISTDPLGLVGGTQAYGFDGSPTDVVDPFGLSTSGGGPHSSPAAEARAWQGTPDYPGVDDYTDVTLKKGTVLYGGYPGPSPYYMTEEAYAASGGSARALADGLQVMPSKTRTHPVSGPYRPQVRKYVVKEDTPSAMGPASANPQYGKGGLTQVYVPSYKDSLDPVETIDLTP